jgi:3-hydroxyisobutyrate dehydrogenase-like beta-hydroxyacid dehydrogenase
MTTSARVGWIGTGEMGTPMCRRLLHAGVDVSVWNRTGSKADGLVAAGAGRVLAPSDLAVDIVFVTVTGAAEVEEVMHGPAGLLHGDAPPAVLVNCSTVSPKASAALRALGAEHGVDYVAAPISASAASAAEGNGVIVASGPAATYDRVQPLLQSIARTVIYAGDGEAALIVKLCSNVLMGAFTHLLFETAALATRGGVEGSAFLDFVNASLIGSPYSVVKAKQYLDGALQLPPHLRALMQRDFAMCFDIARELHQPMPISEAAQAFV